MALLLGIDLGTSKTTCIAVDPETSAIEALSVRNTLGNVTTAADLARGRSEWDVQQLVQVGIDSLREATAQLGPRVRDTVGLGITGQQHGTVIVGSDHSPLTPFINWQDQRGNEQAAPGQTWVEMASERIDAEVGHRTGCRLRTGFLATTLFWMKANDCLPPQGRACFLMDHFAAVLTNSAPLTDPTCAGSAGVFDVPTRGWSNAAIGALGLFPTLFPEIREADHVYGHLTTEVARNTGLPAGLPVFVPIGDHQASFVGSVADRQDSVLLNVGTGAQVAVFTPACEYAFPIELRPFPIAGNLLSYVGLCGGWSFQVLERFMRLVGEQVFGQHITQPIFGILTGLAAQEPIGANELTCQPTFSGTRANPQQRGSFSGVSPQNLTPGLLSRSVLEGMAADYRRAYDAIRAVTGKDQSQLIAAGNGLRENGVLASSVESEFGLAPRTTRHREEAAFGAALIAAVGTGVCRDLSDAGRLIQYEQ